MNQPAVAVRSRWLAASFLMILPLAACSGEKPENLLASARDYLAKNDSSGMAKARPRRH